MGSIFLRGDSWVGEYKDRGKIRRIAFGKKGVVTKTMANEMLKKIEQRVKLGQYDMLDAEIPTLKGFAPEYLNHVKDVIQKRSWYRDEYGSRFFLEFYGDKKLSEITPKDVDDYKTLRLKNDAKPATVNRELQIIRHLFNLAYRWRRFFGRNPVSESGLLEVHNQVERILTFEEETRLLNSSPPYLRAILVCALNTGMRKSEILTLKWSNVDLDTNVITLEHINTKTKTTRRIPINSALRKLLLEHKLKSGGREYVFLNSYGNPYKRHDSIKRAFESALRRAEINRLRFHDLRHTAATRMIEAGASIVAVSRILGHSDIMMTMRNSHPDNSLKQAVELLTNRPSDSVADKFTDSHKSEI